MSPSDIAKVLYAELKAATGSYFSPVTLVIKSLTAEISQPPAHPTDIIKNDSANYISRESLVARSTRTDHNIVDGEMVADPDIVAAFKAARIPGSFYIDLERALVDANRKP